MNGRKYSSGRAGSSCNQCIKNAVEMYQFPFLYSVVTQGSSCSLTLQSWYAFRGSMLPDRRQDTAVGHASGTVWTNDLKFVVHSAPTHEKGKFLIPIIEKCEGLGSVKGWEAVGDDPGTVWTRDLKFGRNSALTQPKENFFKSYNCYELWVGLARAWKMVGNAHGTARAKHWL